MVKNKKIILIEIFLSFLIIFLVYLNQEQGYFIFSTTKMNETYVSFRFDDGLKSQKEAFKILKENNITGSVYIITSKSNSTINWEKNYYLNWEEIEEISEFMEIGSHTLSHRDLTFLPFSEAKKEIEESKKILEEK
ncbi:MAG: polysaccharide deacetylase family protein [Candidatus Pacearchaeota archaeon]